MPRYKNTSLGPVALASGRVLATGEDATFDPGDSELDPHGENQRHIDAGRLAEIEAPPALDDLSRDALNDLATGAGVEEPAKLPNKEAVIAAIHEAEEG